MPGRRRFIQRTLGALGAATLSPSLRAAAAPGVRDRIVADLRGWDAIADHRTGSEGDDATAAWLAAQVRAIGVEPILSEFDFQRRTPDACRVDDGVTAIAGVPLFDGGSTDAGGIRGRLGALGSDAPIGLAFYEPFSGAPQTQALEAARRSSAHRAIVAVAAGQTVKPGLALLNADAYGTPFGPPVLQIATAHGAKLQALAAAGAAAGAEVTVVTTLREDTVPVSNVEATIRGSRPELAPVVVMTPRSAWWTCTAERGGGISLWLEALRRWATEPPERTLLFTANTGHELGHVGLDRFLHANPDLVADAHAWVHLGANFAAAGGEVRYQASEPGLMRLGLDAIAAAGVAAPEITPVAQRPYGEARNVFDGGGRYVSLLGSNRLFHHPDDRWPAAVDLDRTLRLTDAMLDVIAALVRA
ncbi:MAG: hypothetical protein RIC56_12920 [Pseudomonadales bacterium]